MVQIQFPDILPSQTCHSSFHSGKFRCEHGSITSFVLNKSIKSKSKSIQIWSIIDRICFMKYENNLHNAVLIKTKSPLCRRQIRTFRFSISKPVKWIFRASTAKKERNWNKNSTFHSRWKGQKEESCQLWWINSSIENEDDCCEFGQNWF